VTPSFTFKGLFNSKKVTKRARAYYNLGYALQQNGRAAEAADCYQKAIQLQPQFIQAQISLAWILATCPAASLRNGSQAVALMEKANQLSSGKDPKVLRTLAAAYAEAGQFDDAIATAQKAIALARQNGETNVLEKNAEFLNFYLKHQPYHQGRASAGH
jgi:tetratricopeptide (TPR) repeat protein